ncbi:UDP-N-acetylmuramate dehydrogenase [Caldinitratiruptor microaerophilus]|uniref:UDP-N-acetylenolpyruvoylglucosamine reductase n=1 Tax=Caldinitratiruptor microaerophilus TaxID=671077 RepID=A0AA35G865_9FIRM|nr:UDP-N-acetylmuramate dehydrogenase [Caldinitratiruptor microaerophilus]BDG60756.1 UDP-N-acetylenolpyruvoylglucosamine reductase [Caldinitratiruptor microaerophilus]
MARIAERIRRLLRNPGRLREGEPLQRHTTFRIGGPAEFFVTVESPAELSALLSVAREESLPLRVLGNGSNLLVADEGVPGVVVVLGGDLARRRLYGDRVVAGGGHSLPRLALECARRGLGGLEFACAIPGTVGAGLVINAGAHGGDLSQVVTAARVMWRDGREEVLEPAALGFGYRTSCLIDTGAIVTEVEMRLEPADPAALMERVRRYLEHRRATQPTGVPNAGSIFKNPPGDHAGRLIEQAGCKGWRQGDAQVSPRHANFIVNLGHATASDVLVLARRVRDQVRDRFGVCLEPEVRLWGLGPL